jgi:hypothetical protein
MVIGALMMMMSFPHNRTFLEFEFESLPEVFKEGRGFFL